jgi:hypothetical protein
MKESGSVRRKMTYLGTVAVQEDDLADGLITDRSKSESSVLQIKPAKSNKTKQKWEKRKGEGETKRNETERTSPVAI